MNDGLLEGWLGLSLFVYDRGGSFCQRLCGFGGIGGYILFSLVSMAICEEMGDGDGDGDGDGAWDESI